MKVVELTARGKAAKDRLPLVLQLILINPPTEHIFDRFFIDFEIDFGLSFLNEIWIVLVVVMCMVGGGCGGGIRMCGTKQKCKHTFVLWGL